MKTESLISSLSFDLKPVKRLKPPGVRLLIWGLVSLAYVGAGVAFFGVRPDIGVSLRHPGFLLNTFAILVVSLASAGTAFFLSVPGRREARLTDRAVRVSAAFWSVYFILSIVVRYVIQGDSTLVEAGPGMLCVESVLELGLVPAFLLFWMIRKAAPLDLAKAGAFSMLAATALAGFATQWICQYDFPLHFVAWHLLPVVALTGLGMVLGRKFLRRL